MIEFTSGDILKDDVDAIVNTVNCVGIMGRGIALQFKNAWPENFKAYEAACKREEVQPGRMFVYEVGQLTTPRYIINFPTKRHWRGKSRIEDIESKRMQLLTTHSLQLVTVQPKPGEIIAGMIARPGERAGGAQAGPRGAPRREGGGLFQFPGIGQHIQVQVYWI